MPGTTLFLVRHAAHDRLGRVLAGRMPGVTLGEAGREQARRLSGRFSAEAVAAVYTSPMERCRETAAPIARRLGLEVVIEPDLDEIDFGDWTGLGFDALRQDARWDLWNRERGTASPPGGEPMTVVQERASAALERCRERHPEAGVVAVSHADVIRAIVCRVLGLALDRYHAFEIDPASITTLVAWPGGAKILALNETVAGRPA